MMRCPIGAERLALLGAAAALLWNVAGCREPVAKASNAGEEQPPTLVETVPVERSTKQKKRRYSGYAHPWDAAGIGFMVPGRVTSLKVDIGDEVKEGDLVATIDPDDYQLFSRLANVQLKALKPNVKRVESLVDQQILPKSQLDEIKGKYDAAKLQKMQARRQVNYTELRATASGVVYKKETAVGQVIGAGMPVVILLKVDRLKARFGVTQPDLKHFKVGDEHILSFPGVAPEVKGKIHHIGLVADAKSRTFDVDFEVQNPQRLLRPSMMVHLQLVTEQVTGVFVPLHAIKRNATGNKVAVIVDPETGQAIEKPVELGRLFGDQIHVVSGLDGGEQLIVRGQHFVQDGDKVRVKAP